MTRSVRRLLPRLWRLLACGILLAGCAYWQGPKTDPSLSQGVATVVAGDQFDVVRWEVKAVADKAASLLTVSLPDPTGVEARQRVMAYLERARRVADLRREVERATAMAESEASIDDTEAELQALRQVQVRERPVVERILEAQVGQVLAQANLGWLSTPLPPPLFQFSEPPDYLIVSPRDAIRVEYGVYLDPALPMRQSQEIEQRVEALNGNVSALVSDTGGYSTWPTMIVDWAGIDWVLSTIAHEWAHVYLMPYPLGRHYYDSSETTAMNGLWLRSSARKSGDWLSLATTQNSPSRPSPPAER